MKSVLQDSLYFGPPVGCSAVSILDLPVEIDDYDTKVVYAALQPYLTQGLTVLDLGCGNDYDMAVPLIDAGCIYYGIDHDYMSIRSLQEYLLNHYSEKKYNLRHNNVMDELFGFEDDSFDIIIVKSLLCHISTAEVGEFIKQLYRVAKQAIFVVEISWSRLGNVVNQKIFEDYRSSAAQLLNSHGGDGYLYNTLPSVLVKALPETRMEVFRVDDRPEGDYVDELWPVAMGARDCLEYCYSGQNASKIRQSMDNMVDLLDSGPVICNPPAVIVAHMPKS